ncbi:MAG TPA: hypothetical protein DCZ13_09980, partial [Porticoccaceae bacterium]|nr:hypothetical protein [Porticoccaceae bacterium]
MADRHEQLASLAGLDDAAFFDDPVDLITYRRDTSSYAPGKPEGVVRPRSPEAVVEIIKRANRDKLPVYTRGGASMYAGGVNPEH